MADVIHDFSPDHLRKEIIAHMLETERLFFTA